MRYSSGYYDWLDRTPSRRAIENQKIESTIKIIYQESKGRYGSPKITKELEHRGMIVSRPRVARMMRSEGIKSIIQKKYRVVYVEATCSRLAQAQLAHFRTACI